MRKHLLLIALAIFCGLSVAQAGQSTQQARHDSILNHILTSVNHPQGQVLNIRSFGAKGDGIKDCKPAFDKAMRKIAKVGTPSRLMVPAGTWHICGPIHLVSHLELHLEEGAVLQFDDDPSYYLPAVATSWEGSFCYNYSPFIYGKDLDDVSITGPGTIDGNAGRSFATWRAHQKPAQQRLRDQDHQEVPQTERCYGEGDYLRPHLIQLYNCRNVTLSDFFITNSPFWCVHLLQCENVICDGLRYDAKLVNNDGIDPEMSRNVLIQNIVFNNGDDNVAIKSGRDNDGWQHSPSEGIIIRNCSFKGLHAVVIGSEMSAGVRNVWVEDCTYGGYCKRALYVKTNPNRGGFVHDIYFRDCTFDEVEDLFYITSMYAGEGADDTHFTDIHDIHAQDITCRKASNAALVLQGTEAMPLRDISFTRIKVGEVKIGFSSSNTEDIILRNCHLGGEIISAPSQAAHKDNLWR